MASCPPEVTVNRAQTLNITCKQGQKFRLPFEWKDPDGVAINLTGYTFRGQVRASAKDAAVILELNATLVSAVAGTFKIEHTSAEMADVPAGKWVYDLEAVQGGESFPLAEGTFTVLPEVTR
jgi:hypothetical protein